MLHQNQMFIGTILSVNTKGGYGYVTPQWGNGKFDENLFFHFKQLMSHRCYAKVGTQVAFNLKKDREGRWMAANLVDTTYLDPVYLEEFKNNGRPDFLPSANELREDRLKIKRIGTTKIIENLQKEEDDLNIQLSPTCEKQIGEKVDIMLSGVFGKEAM